MHFERAPASRLNMRVDAVHSAGWVHADINPSSLTSAMTTFNWLDSRVGLWSGRIESPA